MIIWCPWVILAPHRGKQWLCWVYLRPPGGFPPHQLGPRPGSVPPAWPACPTLYRGPSFINTNCNSARCRCLTLWQDERWKFGHQVASNASFQTLREAQWTQTIDLVTQVINRKFGHIALPLASSVKSTKHQWVCDTRTHRLNPRFTCVR